MSTPTDTLVEFVGVVKDYQSLRPLRIAEFRMRAGAVVSIAGIDALGSEVLVNLMTAAMQPDVGAIRLFGHATDAIVDYDGWLQMLDGFGLLTKWAVLLGQCTLAQNLALPLTIEIDPIRPEIRPQVRARAAEVGIEPSPGRARRREPADDGAARASGPGLGAGPAAVVAEHPTASLPREAVESFARDLAAIAARRGLGLLAVSMDREFVRALGGTRSPSTRSPACWPSPDCWRDGG